MDGAQEESQLGHQENSDLIYQSNWLMQWSKLFKILINQTKIRYPLNISKLVILRGYLTSWGYSPEFLD